MAEKSGHLHFSMIVEKRRETYGSFQVIRLNGYGGMSGVHLAIPEALRELHEYTNCTQSGR
jgi:hypothetical protein